jgi:hypothetical protein
MQEALGKRRGQTAAFFMVMQPLASPQRAGNPLPNNFLVVI